MENAVCFLVDDDEDDRDIFIMALESADDSYSCITAKNGLDAIHQIDANPDFIPNFIFIDLNMPYMSGKECLQQIKQKSHLAHIPVIMYTTSSYNKDVEETKQLGASHFLVKPPGLNSLTKMLRDILKGENVPYYLYTED